MEFLPVDRMWDRINISRGDSDVAFAFDLLIFGELITKIVALGLVAGLEDSPEHHQYRLLHGLVRSDGIGDWSTAIDNVLTGPAAQVLCRGAQQEQTELTQKNGEGTWQFDAVELLNDCLRNIDEETEQLTKVEGRRWFVTFARLRNKTRGHGAMPGGQIASICDPLEKSLRLITENFCLFRRPWAYLYRNLSGKYRVTKWTQVASILDPLKSDLVKELPFSLADGVYIHFGGSFEMLKNNPSLVPLLVSDVDATDILLPNGAFNERTFEMISYINGNRAEIDAVPYLDPATDLPASETQGLGNLDIQGKCFGNLPAKPIGYVRRPALEKELYDVLCSERHSVITLVGRGGIGKTWLTLTILHEITNVDRFSLVLWFSSRDIDLLPTGPKLVEPHILTEMDLAKEFVALLAPDEAKTIKKFNATNFLNEQLTLSKYGPILFVFDNFETVRSPATFFKGIDTYIRPPNKVLITTRDRDFKGDYPVEVHGMSRSEYIELLDSASKELGIEGLLTKEYRETLYRESDGHPYVIKIMLGEVAKAGQLVAPKRIAASRDEILSALFERTYSRLSPVAKRVFLTLCALGVTMPQIGLEAVLLRPANDRMDTEQAIDHLRMASFIEVSSAEDSTLFISVPLIARIFGQRKLAVSELKTAIEADMPFLQAFGAARATDTQHGIAFQINRMVRTVADRVSSKKEILDDYIPMLEFVARHYPPAWLLIASLYEELDNEGKETEYRGLKKAIESVKGYLEFEIATPSDVDIHIHYENMQEAWGHLANLYTQIGDHSGEIHALVEMCRIPNISFNLISDSANRLNQIFSQRLVELDKDEKRLLVQKLVEVMEQRLAEANSTDCSRLAWLCNHLQDYTRAALYTRVGLERDPQNSYCIKLSQLPVILKELE